MLFLLYSETNAATLTKRLGAAEYSYFFVLEYFRLMLEQHGQQYILIADPECEADIHYDAATRSGQKCVLLSFAPPHRTFLGLRCPTLPIFAWEFDTLPDEVWDGDPRNDWRTVLGDLGHAITHSQYSVDAIERAMGERFPVLAIPAPVFGRFRREVPEPSRELIVSGSVLDSRDGWEVEASPVGIASVHEPAVRLARKSMRQLLRLTITHFAEWYRAVVRDALPVPLQRLASRLGRAALWCLKLISGRGQHEVTGRDTIYENAAAASALADDRKLLSLLAEAIVYTSVFNPNDGRKNWGDILTAFCRALSGCEDAVLILKFTSVDTTSAMDHVRDTLGRLPPFQCRVLALGGHLEESQYGRLIAASTYVVNNSLSEGQCLPLMEFLSNGKPAIAPRNTAMIDYFDAEIGFMVNCSKELCCWPHDARNFFRAHRFRTDWQSLAEAFSASYELKRRNPRRYDEMARAAVARMRDFCSDPVVWEKFARFIEVQLRPQMNQSLPPVKDYTTGTEQFASPAFAGRG